MAFKVFLSSEMRHLAETRRVLKERLERSLHHIPVEVTGIDFTTGNDKSSTMGQCIRLVEEADLFVVLIGQRIGRYNQVGFTGTEIEIHTALRADIPKIIVDLSPGASFSADHIFAQRDLELTHLFSWLTSANGAYFRLIEAYDQGELITRLSRQIEQDHAMIHQRHQKTYFKSVSTALSREINETGAADIDEKTFPEHHQQLLADYEYALYHGEQGKVLSERLYIYGFLRQTLTADSKYLALPLLNREFLYQVARSLQVFAECFNLNHHGGIVNHQANWCAQTASYIYTLIGDLTNYRASLLPHLQLLYTASSKLRQRFGRSTKETEDARERLLLKARDYSNYLYYLDGRSSEKSIYFPDNGYQAYILRDLGSPDQAVKLFKKIVNRRQNMNMPSYDQLAQLVYTQSISTDQTGLKKNLAKLEEHLFQQAEGKADLLTKRTLMDIYFSTGEVSKGHALYDELIVEAMSRRLKVEVDKLNQSRNGFLRKRWR